MAEGRRRSQPTRRRGPDLQPNPRNSVRDASGHLYAISRDTTKVEAMGLEPTNLLTASQALYQLSYAPWGARPRYQPAPRALLERGGWRGAR